MAESVQTWFPGQDYPDREKWLAKRATPRKINRDVVVFPAGKKPMVLGLNRIKRGITKEERQYLVKCRHEYYTKSGA